MTDFKGVVKNLISNLSKREFEVICRRFGLEKSEKETLEKIGKDFGVCRERVRQIEQRAIKKLNLRIDEFKDVFAIFFNYFEKKGGFKKEEILIEDFGKEFENEILFLLCLKKDFFKRFKENKDFFTFWMVSQQKIENIFFTSDLLIKKFQEIGKPLSFDQLKSFFDLKEEFLLSFLEISKRILINQKGLYGLEQWPEIRPKKVIDKVYLVFKEQKKPLHFKNLADFIENVNLATCHNELIKDKRFVLVGRGIYALKEWGYFPGYVKDVIFSILKQENRPLSKEEIIEKVLQQRFVKESTILQNLANRNFFMRNSEGKYWFKEA